MNLTSFAIQKTGLSAGALFVGPAPLVRIQADVAGNQSIASWSVPGVPEPTSAEIAAALAAPEPAKPLPQLAAALITAASTACGALTTQVVPDQTHQNAYVNAAAMVGPAAVVPTADPAKTAFASLASAYGAQPQAFATLVVAIAAASCSLSAVLATLETGAQTASSPAQLATDLTAFETALNSIVAAITAAGVTVTAPEPISIVGINA